MLTSFFSKSKPVNLSLIITFLTVFYLAINILHWQEGTSEWVILQKAAVLIALIFSVLLLNFIAKKNELTKRSAYKTLLFTIFVVSFSWLLRNDSVIVANLFVLFAARRLVSLRSRKFVKKKILDASFWIFIASLYDFWAVLFIILVFVAIVNFASTIKNWLIPMVAFLGVALLVNSFHIIVYDSWYTLTDWFQVTNFDFSNYQDIKILTPLSILLALLLWTTFYYLNTIQKASVSRRATLSIIIIYLCVAVAAAVMSPFKNGSELIYFFVPLSIIASNYLDSRKDLIFKEILLAALIIMPIIVLFL